ncbi:unnamed protein product [Vicia faba]|uniref:Reverse transcriptase zinc-binding domain-containing protein n=1 Tax=Vicia faba TaxID=3906 RepID=A0AAV0Z4N0_VICFA|nr:unnamed protein product [Vicia faba]
MAALWRYWRHFNLKLKREYLMPYLKANLTLLGNNGHQYQTVLKIKDLVRKMLNPDPKKRITSTQVLVGELPSSQNGRLIWCGSWEGSLDVDEVRKEEELKVRIQLFSLRDNVRDSWVWHKSVCSVKEAYSVIIEDITNVRIEDRKLVVVWNNLIPLKVSTLVWRIWKNRIPLRDNLVSRGILVVSQNSCPHGCGREENVANIFFECPLA